MTVEVVICDCDGVIVDSEILAEQVLVDLLAAYAPVADIAALVRESFGLSSSSILNAAAWRFGVTLPASLYAEVRARTDAAIETGVQPIPGVRTALEALGLPLAIVSNSLNRIVRSSVRRAGIEDLVAGRIFSADMVASPKPAPDLYLLAAATMGVPPARCLAIEDSSAGVTAALAAGMRAIGFTGASHVPPVHAEHLARLGVAAVVRTMEDLPPAVRRIAARTREGSSRAPPR
ncbi:MAG TPA: HAD family hydrolase [Burkholderiaceae bacterium]